MRAASVILATALSLTTAGLAHANSPAWRGCSYQTAPRLYAGDLMLSLPVNVPAIALLTEAGPGVVARFQDNRGTLRTKAAPGGPDGGAPLPEPVDVTVEVDAHRPDVMIARLARPLAVGQEVSVGLDLRCDGGEPPGGSAVGLGFRTTAAVPSPTQIGDIVSVTSPGVGGVYEAPRTEIVVDVSPELAAYLPVTELSVASKDGTRIAFDYGAVEYAVEGKVTFGLSKDSLHVTQQHARAGAFGQQRRPGGRFVSFCGPDDDGVKRLSLELRAHVAGMSTDPPALPFEADVRCVPEPEMNACHVGRPGAQGPSSFHAQWLYAITSALLALARMARRSCGRGSFPPPHP